MKILVINCSPVKNGATAQIVRLVSEFCGKGNEVRSVCIGDYEIKLCRGCRKCHETAECSISDDTKKLMAEFWLMKKWWPMHSAFQMPKCSSGSTNLIGIA